MQGSESSDAAIAKLCAELGTDGAVRVLEFALPRIIAFENDLKHFLLAEDRQSAAACAHRAISSVRAYGTMRLEKLLRAVADEDSDLQQLQPALSGEFVQVIDTVNVWLKTRT